MTHGGDHVVDEDTDEDQGPIIGDVQESIALEELEEIHVNSIGLLQIDCGIWSSSHW